MLLFQQNFLNPPLWLSSLVRIDLVMLISIVPTAILRDTVDRCYKFHGFPPGFKPKNRSHGSENFGSNNEAFGNFGNSSNFKNSSQVCNASTTVISSSGDYSALASQCK